MVSRVVTVLTGLAGEGHAVLAEQGIPPHPRPLTGHRVPTRQTPDPLNFYGYSPVERGGCGSRTHEAG